MISHYVLISIDVLITIMRITIMIMTKIIMMMIIMMMLMMMMMIINVNIIIMEYFFFISLLQIFRQVAYPDISKQALTHPPTHSYIDTVTHTYTHTHTHTHTPIVSHIKPLVLKLVNDKPITVFPIHESYTNRVLYQSESEFLVV